MRALIFENKIVQVVEEDFPVHKDLHFIDCPDDCKSTDWTLVDGVPTAPTPKVDDGLTYARTRSIAYPNWQEFAEAYTEKEIGEDSTKWDAYVTAYNKVRSDNQKP